MQQQRQEETLPQKQGGERGLSEQSLRSTSVPRLVPQRDGRGLSNSVLSYGCQNT